LISSPPELQGKADLAGLDAGIIVITSSAESAEVSADPPNRRVQSASEGAEDATRSFLNTPNLGNPQLEAGLGAVQFALSPFAAAYGAVSARQLRLSPSEASDAQEQLAQNMKSNAVPETLAQRVGEAAREKTRRLLVCTSSLSTAPTNGTRVSAVLEVAVKQFRLKVDKPGGDQYRLSIGASARLVRAADGRVMLERSYHYESGAALFVDWTRNRGVEDVAQTGYQVLAGQIAAEIFEPASLAPMLIGPGQKSSRASRVQMLGRAADLAPRRRRSTHDEVRTDYERWPVEMGPPQVLIRTAYVRSLSHLAENERRRLGRQDPRLFSMPRASPLRFVSLLQEELGSVEVHTGKMDERIRSPKPGPELGSASGGPSDTKWAVDGLEEDRNAVVQGISCLAAVPMGLWEQTVGVIQNHSRDKLMEFSRALNAVTTPQHLEADLADEVARSLQSKVVDPVVRTEEPMRFGLSSQAETGTRGTALTSAPVKSKTALEIQVLSTRLVGKHRNSKSRAVLVEVQATIFRISDGQELYSRPIRYLSSEKRLKDWAASDALLFRRELEACSRRTAQALVSDVVARGFVTPLTNSNSPILDPRN
jgi:hypothetical protein